MNGKELTDIIEFKIPRGWHEVDHVTAFRERELSPELQEALAEDNRLYSPYSDELTLEPVDENSWAASLKIYLSEHDLTPIELRDAKEYFASNHPIELDDFADMPLFSMHYTDEPDETGALQPAGKKEGEEPKADSAPTAQELGTKTADEMEKGAALLEEYHELKVTAQKLQAMADAEEAPPWQVFPLGAKVDSVGTMRAAIIGRRCEQEGKEPISMRTLHCHIPAFHSVTAPNNTVDMIEIHFRCLLEDWDELFLVVDGFLQSLKWKSRDKN